MDTDSFLSWIPLKLLRENPNFSKLLSNLSEHILSEDGVDLTISSESNKARVLMERAKESYFYYYIFYSELHALLLENEPEFNSYKSKNYSFSNEIKALNEAFQLSETLQLITHSQIYSLKEDSSSKVPERIRILGLEKELFSSVEQQKIRAIERTVMEKLHDRLLNNCDILCSYYRARRESMLLSSLSYRFLDHNGNENSIQQFLETLQAEKILLEKEKLLSQETKRKNEQSYCEYLKILEKTLALFIAITKDYKIGDQFQYYQQLAEWLYARFNTMVLKLKTLEGHYETEMYTQETVGALNTICSLLEDAFRDASSKYQGLIRQLNKYDSAGFGFNALAIEYAGILDEIKEKSWALSELRKDLKVDR